MSENQAVAARRVQRAAKRAECAAKAEIVKQHGNELFKKGAYQGACDAYIAAMRLNGAPTPVLLSNLAAAYNKLEMYEWANWSAGAALEYDPRMVKARFRRAMARKEIFGYTAAKEDLEGILALEPDNKDAKNQLPLVEKLIRTEGGFPADECVTYPSVREEPWDIYYDSDSEDCKHQGNQTPCRHYNRGTCNKGNQCNFSHAPDDKSVRDDLGRNVCINFLMSDCKFGAERCVYSHSRTYLSDDGWWNHPHEIIVAKKVLPHLNQLTASYSSMRDVLITNPKARRFAARAECKAVLASNHPSPECSDENALYEKIIALRPQASPPAPASFVLVLSFDHEDYYTNIQKHLYSTLEQKTKTVHVRFEHDAAQKALRLLESPELGSVLITDAGITKKKYHKVVEKLVAFVKNGGSAAIGGQFSNNVSGDKFDNFMRRFGLGWKYGSYFRTTFTANPGNELVQRNPSLPKSYSMKTLHVGGITPEMAVYAATSDSRLTSMVWDPVPVSDISNNESPAVTARVGKGLFGFVGDVNGENGSTNVLLAMLGLLDSPNTVPRSQNAGASGLAPNVQPSTSRAPQATNTRQGMNAQPQASPSTSAQPSANIFTEMEAMLKNGFQGPARTKFFSPNQATDKPKAPRPVLPKITDKSVLVMNLDAQSVFQDRYDEQLILLGKRIAFDVVYDGYEALELLASPSLHGVYVVDSGIAEPENAEVLQALRRYVHGGGLVVLGGVLPVDLDSDDLKGVFEALGLPWRAGSYCKSEAQLNMHHETAVRNPDLADAYSLKAVHVRGFHPEALLHQQHFTEYETQLNFEAPNNGEWESAILREKVGKGHVGYIGDVGPEPETTDVLLAMFELLTPPQPLVPDSSKFILVLSGYDQTTMEQLVPDFLSDLKSKVEVHIGMGVLSKARVLDLLPSRDLVGVFVTDSDVLFPQNAYLLSKLVEYSKNGGTLVFGWRFCKLVTTTQFRPLFRENWGLPWDMVSIHPSAVTVNSNPGNALVKKTQDKLVKTTKMTGIIVSGIEESMAAYFPSNKKEFWNRQQAVYKAPILFTPVEKGYLGYIGVASLEGDIRSVLYAMFDLL